MRTVFVVPAYQAAASIGAVVRELLACAGPALGTTGADVFVIDDGSSDATRRRAEEAGATVLANSENRGKGSALRLGLGAARDAGASAAVTLDADGQHPAEEAVRLARDPAPPEALVLGVRDLVRDGAPRANRFSNAFSNAWISLFARRKLSDTQCGLRRYPVPETLELGLAGSGYELESEVIVKAARRGLPIVEVPVRVIYPPAEQRVSHFHSFRDPTRIVLRLLYTAATTPWRTEGR